MTAHFASTLPWLPIDDRARNGSSWLLNCGEELAVALWNGERFVHPGTSGHPLELVPICYYDPALQQGGARG